MAGHKKRNISSRLESVSFLFESHPFIHWCEEVGSKFVSHSFQNLIRSILVTSSSMSVITHQHHLIFKNWIWPVLHLPIVIHIPSCVHSPNTIPNTNVRKWKAKTVYSSHMRMNHSSSIRECLFSSSMRCSSLPRMSCFAARWCERFTPRKCIIAFLIRLTADVILST